MAYITIEEYNLFKDYIHAYIKDCIDHYRHKNIIHLPAYNGCNTVNKNGTRKLVEDISVFVQQIKDIGGEKKSKIQNKLRLF